jgi:hypothetical protein
MNFPIDRFIIKVYNKTGSHVSSTILEEVFMRSTCQVLSIVLLFVLAACTKEKSSSGPSDVSLPVSQAAAAPGASSARSIASSPAPPTHATHLVRRGQFLRYVAYKHDVAAEAMLLVNEDFLEKKYREVCGDLSRSFRTRRHDRGARKGGLYYCNDRFVRPYGNTLRPGWRLSIPTGSAPAKISTVIGNIKGNSVALVIDDTGSMGNDRQKVGEFYLAALRQYKKHLAGVWLYTDGRVRKYEAGNVRFLTSGGFENTFGALREAAREKPDAIVLVTDEPGDDWQWDEVKNLPPVFAHCLPERGRYLCEKNLLRLKDETGGQYIAGVE